MKQARQVLEQFSLSPQGAELYLLLLKQGATHVSHLAQLQKKNRAAVYFHLRHLLERGLVKETRVGRRPLYVAMPPKELADLLDRWTTEFKSLVPELETLKMLESDKPLMEVYTSPAGMKRVYDDVSVQPAGSEFLVLEGVSAMKGELKLLQAKEWTHFFTRIVERRILTRAVFTNESFEIPQKVLSKENTRLLGMRLWDLRTLPESKMPFDHLLMLYGNKAAFMIPETKLLFILDHQGIIGILRAMFKTIHSFAEPVKGGWRVKKPNDN